MKKSKLMAALIALLMSASILPLQARAEEETSEEAAPVEEVIEVVETAPAEEIVEVAEPADAEVEAEIALTAEPEVVEAKEQTEVSEPAAPVEETVKAEAETEETGEAAAEPFTCKIGITTLNREAIREGDEVILAATVTDASMAYTLRWESRPTAADPDDPWHLEGTDESIAFTAAEAAAARDYRVSALGEDGTVHISRIWNFTLAEPEMTAESVEEAIPEEESLEIEDYETPLGLGMSIVLENTGDAEAAPVDVREGADGMSAIFTSLPEAAEITVIAVEGDWVSVTVNGKPGYIYRKDLEGIAGLTETEVIDAAQPKVTIFSSRRSIMHVGETITLTGKLEGFGDADVTLQWEKDVHDGTGYQPIEGADEADYDFIASAESLSWDWRLTVTYN